MNAHELRGIQAPFKQRYQTDPEAAQATLTASGVVDFASLSVKSEYSGPAWNQPGMHPMTGGDGTHACAAEMLLHALVG